MYSAANVADVRNRVLLTIRQLPYLDESIYIHQARNILSLDEISLMRDSVAKSVSIEEILLCLCDEILPQLGSTGIILTYNSMYIKSSKASLHVSFDKVKKIYADKSSLFVNDFEFKFSPKMKHLKELEDIVRDVITQCDFSCCSSHVEKYVLEHENALPQKNSSEKKDFTVERNKKGKMICCSCGTEIAGDFKFCPECGAKLGCPNCGCTQIPVNAKFCPECGSKMTENATNAGFGTQVQPVEKLNREWINSETYANLEREIDLLISKMFDVTQEGEKYVTIVRPFLTSHIFSNLIVANNARIYENNELLYDAYIMNLCDFSMSAEEFENEVKEQLLLATPYALINVNLIVNSVSQKTGMDLSEIRLNEFGMDDWYLDNLKSDLQNLFSEIRKQVSFYPRLKNAMDAVKAKIGKYNSQNFLQRNKDAIVHAGVNFARELFGDATVIADGFKEFFSDNTDPDYRTYLETAEQIMELSENGWNAAYCLENDFEEFYLDTLVNGDFKNWLLDACKKMINMGIAESIISESIQERIALFSVFDDEDDDDSSEERFRSLDVYDDYFCNAMVSKDSVAQQPMWDLSCLMLDCLLMSDTFYNYPNNADFTLEDLKTKFNEFNSAVNFLNNPFREYMQNVVAENLSTVRNERNASTLYIVSNNDGNDDCKFDFDEDKLYAARDKYAPNIMISEILAYYDDTLFGKGDDGFILTSNNLYIKELGSDVSVISLDDIKEIYWSEKKQWLGTSRYLQINGVDYSCGLEENDLNLLVLGLRKIVAEYQSI